MRVPASRYSITSPSLPRADDIWSHFCLFPVKCKRLLGCQRVFNRVWKDRYPPGFKNPDTSPLQLNSCSRGPFQISTWSTPTHSTKNLYENRALSVYQPSYHESPFPTRKTTLLPGRRHLKEQTPIHLNITETWNLFPDVPSKWF